MKKLFSFIAVICFATTVSAQYQVGNSDFETDWTDTNEPGNGWNSFPSASTNGLNAITASIAKSTSKPTTTKVGGRGGGYAVQLKSLNLSLAKANGNLTTGQINMGNSTPANEANYNYTNTGSSKNKCPLTGRPDAFEYWAKFTRGQNGSYNGRCHAIIHGDMDYRDPYETADNEAAYKIAEVTVYATPCTEWTKFDGEFTYTGVESNTTSYLLATFTTNETPGGSYNDIFIIDDIKLIYYSQLKSLTVNGVSVPDFDKNVYNYTVDSYYIEGTTSVVAVDNTKAGVASVVGSYNPQEAKYTIVVTNQEGTESHTYTIQFKPFEAELLALTYDGQNLPFDGGDITEAVINGPFDANKLSFTQSDYATVVVNDYDEDQRLLSIDVNSKDGRVSNTYEIQLYYKGDVNNDGQTSIADVTSLVNIILGKSTEYKKSVADVNKDNDISIADVTALVNIILGKN